jgi:hypothetical protein
MKTLDAETASKKIAKALPEASALEHGNWTCIALLTAAARVRARHALMWEAGGTVTTAQIRDIRNDLDEARRLEREAYETLKTRFRD